MDRISAAYESLATRRSADELGPAKVIQVCEPGRGLKAVVVIDNVARGPSIGGLRMAVDVSVEECSRLARAMTHKNAAAGIPHGGGKSVLWGDPRCGIRLARGRSSTRMGSMCTPSRTTRTPATRSRRTTRAAHKPPMSSTRPTRTGCAPD